MSKCNKINGAMQKYGCWQYTVSTLLVLCNLGLDGLLQIGYYSHGRSGHVRPIRNIPWLFISSVGDHPPVELVWTSFLCQWATLDCQPFEFEVVLSYWRYANWILLVLCKLGPGAAQCRPRKYSRTCATRSSGSLADISTPESAVGSAARISWNVESYREL